MQDFDEMHLQPRKLQFNAEEKALGLRLNDGSNHRQVAPIVVVVVVVIDAARLSHRCVWNV